MNKNLDRKTITDHARNIFKGGFGALAAFLTRLGVKPNMVTLAGLFGQIIAAYFVAIGQIPLAGLITLVAAPFDFLDGTMARLLGESSSFGAFVDSVSDRYSELVIMGGLLFYYIQKQDILAISLVFLAAAGSMLVPYIRSRAEALGFNAKIGLLSRLERYLVLIPCLIFNYPIIALWVIAILSNFTALQRIYHVRNQFYQQTRKLD
jgi:CDP-diacylglycerol--glycerol-3-phosphate 3-phosphatidyltransferase